MYLLSIYGPGKFFKKLMSHFEAAHYSDAKFLSIKEMTIYLLYY